MIKLIASDMDGTLVSSQHVITAATAKAVQQAQAAGVEFVITTGRSYDDAYPQVHAAGISCNYLVMNGSELRNTDGEIVQALYLDHQTAEAVVEMLEAEAFYIELYTTAGVYSTSSLDICKQAVATKINNFFPDISLEQGYEMADGHELLSGIERIDSLKELWLNEVEVGKILTFSNRIERLAELRKQLPDRLAVTATGSFAINLEITNPKANKGDALKQYALSKGIHLSQVMTIGDSYNDLTMLGNEFGYTVSMANALPEVKRQAKYLTASNDEDGVAKIINKLLKQVPSAG